MSHDFTHFDEQGAARQVDVTHKAATRREAVAEARVVMSRATLEALQSGALAKGDALAVARVAGIMAAKETARLIPLCHPIPLGKTEVVFEVVLGGEAAEDAKLAAWGLAPGDAVLRIEVRTAATHTTGVEMEALTGASIAALAVYDMIKAREKGAHIEGVRLLRKTGGQSGDFTAKDELKGLRGAARIGIAQADAGDFAASTPEEMKARVRARAKRRP